MFEEEKMIGKSFGKLTIVKFLGTIKGYKRCECLCECGNRTIVRYSSLISNNTKSCGCSKYLGAKQRIDNLVGQRFGRLVVLCQAPNKLNKVAWNCKCDCGKKVVVIANYLKTGRTKSCGCLKRDCELYQSITHNKSYHPLYRTYKSMLRRCYRPDNEYTKYLYKDRGIKVCKEWLGKNGFINFYNWAISNGWNDERYPSGRHKLSLDRIDNDGNYEPSNCRFATQSQQSKNQRHTPANTINIKELKKQKIHYKRSSYENEINT